jgi:hypothetical protein
VGLRPLLTASLLAHAGYDPRAAVARFAGSLTRLEEIHEPEEPKPWWNLFKLWAKDRHPAAGERVAAMVGELERWEKEEEKEKEKEKEKERRAEGGEEGGEKQVRDR